MTKKHKNNDEMNDTTNSTVYNRASRFLLNCSFCPPNRAENAKRRANRRSWKKFRKKKFK